MNTKLLLKYLEFTLYIRKNGIKARIAPSMGA